MFKGVFVHSEYCNWWHVDIVQLSKGDVLSVNDRVLHYNIDQQTDYNMLPLNLFTTALHCRAVWEAKLFWLQFCYVYPSRNLKMYINMVDLLFIYDDYDLNMNFYLQ